MTAGSLALVPSNYLFQVDIAGGALVSLFITGTILDFAGDFHIDIFPL